MRGVERIKLFVDKHGENILQCIRGKQIYFPMVIAQYCVESGYGDSDVALKYNNFAGIKNLSGKVPLAIGTSPAPGKYAIFATPLDCFKCHIAVITAERYRAKGVFRANSPEEQIEAIAYGGYCVDPPPAKYLEHVLEMMGKVKKVYPTIGKIV